jgi:hypothetical protein
MTADRVFCEEKTMGRLFFDLVRGPQRQLDFNGRQVGNLDEAREFAQLLSLDAGADEESPWKGAEVHVLDHTGTLLLRERVPAFI